jgi:hypothetical protein
MNPEALWKRFLDSLTSEDDADARDALEELCSWLRSGGAPPEGILPGAVHRLYEMLGGEDDDLYDDLLAGGEESE